MDGLKRVMVAKEQAWSRKHSNGSGISLADFSGRSVRKIGCQLYCTSGHWFSEEFGIGSQRNRINGLLLLPSEYDGCICKVTHKVFGL